MTHNILKTSTLSIFAASALIFSGCTGGGSSSPSTPSVPKIDNTIPISNFSQSETLSNGSTVKNFNASSSTDDKGIVEYLWSVSSTSGSFTSNGQILHLSSFDAGVSYEISLTVTDTDGNKSTKKLKFIFDRDNHGFDKLGWSKNNINKETNTLFNVDGFDIKGYNKSGFNVDGYNNSGFNVDGYNKLGFNTDGYNKLGFDTNGYNKLGFNTNGYNKLGFNIDGYNKLGFNSDGYNKLGFNTDGYNKNGYNNLGFDKDGYNENHFNSDGYNSNGFDSNGYNKLGFNSDGYNKDGYNKDGYNKNGYNESGFDKNGYNIDGYDVDGYNENGYNKDGYNKLGFDSNGFDKNGYDKDSYNIDGYDKDGYNKDNRDINGYDRDGYNLDGYDINGYNKSGYDESGYNKDGYNTSGYDKNGYNIDGYDVDGYDSNGYDKNGYNKDGYDKDGVHKDGKYETSKGTPFTSDEISTYEYSKSGFLSKINVMEAYNQGYTGKGITVGVIDTGVSKKNRDFENKIVGGVSFFKDTVDGEVLGVFSDDSLTSVTFNGGVDTKYDVAPTVVVSGDGSNATAIAILDDRETIVVRYNEGDANYDESVDLDDGYKDGYSDITEDNPKYKTVVDVKIVDEGSNYTSAKFLIDGVEIADGVLGSDDRIGHGSHVAGIIAANRNGEGTHGIAFDSDIVSIRVLDKKGFTNFETITRGVEFGTSLHLKVSNISIASQYIDSESLTSDNIARFRNAMNNDHSLIFASGNDGLSCLPDSNGNINGHCSPMAALPALVDYKDLRENDGAWIVVGSVDDNNVISEFSNRAGVTKDFFMVAPGENVTSSGLSTNPDINSIKTGTSMAAPMVTGAFALLAQKYPYLKGKDIEQILFAGADDLGAKGVDDIYGHGLLNIGRSMAPIGSLTLPNRKSANDSTLTISNNIQANSLVSSSLTNVLSDVMVLDSFKRGYNVNLSNTVSSNENLFDFNDFSTVKYGKTLVGLNESTQSFSFGQMVSDDTNVMVSSTSDFFGNEFQGLGVDSSRTYYLKTSTKFTPAKSTSIAFNTTLGYSSGAKGSSIVSEVSPSTAISTSVDITSNIDNKNILSLNVSMPMSIVKGNINTSVPSERIGDEIIYKNKSSSLAQTKPIEFNLGYTSTLSDSSFVAMNVSSSFNSITSETETKSTASFNFQY
jgi:subtilisin family serine protease